MRVYAQKPSQPKQETSLHPSRITPHTIGNQAVPEAPHANAEGLKGSASSSATTGFGHDFSRIPVYSKSQLSLQTKLTVNTPGDIYEQEADRVAEQVTSMPEPQLQRTCECGGGCPKCQNGQTADQRLQSKRVPANHSGAISAPPIVHEVLHSPGQPLDTTTQGFMESRFGHDFSRVRIHANARAAESARAVNASAYTVGRDVVFGTGQFEPGTTHGRRLLAHELAHVVQQRAGVHLKNGMSEPGDPYEQQADAVANQVVNGLPRARDGRSMLHPGDQPRVTGNPQLRSLSQQTTEFEMVSAPPLESVQGAGSVLALQKQEGGGKKVPELTKTFPELDVNPARGSMQRAQLLAKYPGSDQTARASDSGADFLNNFLLALDRLAKRMEGHATQGIGLFMWGEAPSGENSTATKATKNAVILNKDPIELSEVFEWMDLILISVSTKEELFTTWKDLKKEPVKVYEITKEVKDKIKDIKAAFEEERKNEEAEKKKTPAGGKSKEVAIRMSQIVSKIRDLQKVVEESKAKKPTGKGAGPDEHKTLIKAEGAKAIPNSQIHGPFRNWKLVYATPGLRNVGAVQIGFNTGIGPGNGIEWGYYVYVYEWDPGRKRFDWAFKEGGDTTAIMQHWMGTTPSLKAVGRGGGQ